MDLDLPSLRETVFLHSVKEAVNRNTPRSCLMARNWFDEAGSDEVGSKCVGRGGIMLRRLKKEDSAVSLVSILAVLIFSLSGLPAAGAQALKEIRIGSSDVTSTNFSIYYAKDRRFFEREVWIRR